MAKPKILEENPVPMSEVKDKLKEIKERDEELNFRAEKTEEYLKDFDILNVKKAKELKKKLEDLNISRLKNDQIVKIIDLLPKNVVELNTVLQGYTLSIKKKDLEKIVSVVKEFLE